MKPFATRRSPLIALALAVALAGWLLSGRYTEAPETAPTPEAGTPAEQRPPMSVQIREIEARPVTREIVISGRTEPARSVTLRAEAEGRVVAVDAARGQPVAAGDAIARLDARDREARLAEAEATVRQRQLEYEGARKLGSRGLQSETQIAQALAALEAAQARLKQIRVELDHTTIRAPFAGILNERPVEIGDYVGVGDPVGELLELDPLVVTGYVSQQDAARFGIGREATAQLLTGGSIRGRIRYLATDADPATRTFRVEMEAPNPGTTVSAGMTAEIRIPTATVQAHHLSPALLALDDAGRLGVKTVTGDGRVAFNPVTIVQATPAGVWLTGLPERARVITVGQGFVQEGQPVRAVPEQAVAGAPGGEAPRS